MISLSGFNESSMPSGNRCSKLKPAALSSLRLTGAASACKSSLLPQAGAATKSTPAPTFGSAWVMNASYDIIIVSDVLDEVDVEHLIKYSDLRIQDYRYTLGFNALSQRTFFVNILTRDSVSAVKAVFGPVGYVCDPNYYKPVHSWARSAPPKVGDPS